MIQDEIAQSLETESIEKTLSIIELIKSGGLAGQLIIALLTGTTCGGFVYLF